MKSLRFVMLCSVLAMLAASTPAGAQGGVNRPDECLPPNNSAYLAGFHAMYTAQYLMSNPAHSRFTHCANPPTVIGGETMHAFGSQVCFRLSTNRGKTFKDLRAVAQCLVRVRLVEEDPSSETRYFETEMLALDIRGGNLPPGVMIRESPTQPSMGQTRIQRMPGGGFHIDSFFDIFTELSLDGGATWIPSAQPGHVELAEADALREHSISPTTVIGSKAATGRIVLNAPAPPGGANVLLTSDNPNVIVPASVLVPAGLCHKTYAIKTKAVAAVEEANVRATYNGTVLTAPLRLRPIGVKMISLNPKSVKGGNPSTATVTLEAAAGPGPIQVNLSSNNAAASVPANIVIPLGQKTGTFVVTTSAVGAITKAKITAQANNGTAARSATLTITP